MVRETLDYIVMFVRFPVPGKAKTRLIPLGGADIAARLHRRMTEHILGIVRKAARHCHAEILIFTTGAPRRHFRAWLGTDVHYVSQAAGDLGERMESAFRHCFHHGARRVVGIGTDTPELTSDILERSLDGLDGHDVVIGPALDGGYYLIGMKENIPALFSAIDWGTGRVFGQTMAVLGEQRRNVLEMPPLIDVDRPEDVEVLRSDPRFVDIFREQSVISVIIPTLNEEKVIEKTLDQVQRDSTVEVIVVDGGSHDRTREKSNRKGVEVLEVSGGRAAQQNVGASVARGQFLLFLHADTLLPDGYGDIIRATLDHPEIVAGAFGFQTDDTTMTMRLIEWTTAFRSAVLQIPYGDQGLFLEKRVFEEVGGFNDLAIMEDFDLVRRLKRRGAIKTLAEKAMTSSRRWRQLGVFKTTVINQVMIAGYLCGVPLHILKRLYGTGVKTRQTDTDKED